MPPVATASQTVGPYFHLATDRFSIADMAGDVPGEKITIAGRVLDGDGKPVNDALLEIWQAGPDGKLGAPGFRGFGRVATDDEGVFRFVTVKPGRVDGPDGTPQAPHLAVAIFMRGLLRHLVTRIYFPEDAANGQDAVLGLVPSGRRATLIAAKSAQPGTFEWNVRLQGEGETVFFDC